MRKNRSRRSEEKLFQSAAIVKKERTNKLPRRFIHEETMYSHFSLDVFEALMLFHHAFSGSQRIDRMNGLFLYSWRWRFASLSAV